MAETNTGDAFDQFAPVEKAPQRPMQSLMVVTLVIGGILTVAWLGLVGWGASKVAFWFIDKLLDMW